MRHNVIRLIIYGIILVTAACVPQPSPTPTLPPPTVMLPTGTLPPPTITALPPTATPPAFNPDAISEIETWLNKLNTNNLFSGAVLISHKGEVLLSQGYGLADHEQKTPITPQTRFRLASITKQFTAMAILILQAQGKLSVQDPICDYVADCPAAWEPITIHHLLTHTSGIPNFDTSLDEYQSIQATPTSPEQIISRLRDLPLDFQPGEKWSYSNSGYIVLGYIIEQVSGQTYAAFLQQAIFTPLDMRDTGMDHNTNGVALGYTSRFSPPVSLSDASHYYAAGGLFSTVEDLYKWDQALYTEQLLPAAQLEQMFTAQVEMPDSGGFAYGYGWFIGPEGERKVVGHNGYIEGFVSLIARYPDDQICVILLSNEQDENLVYMLEIISKKLFGEK